MRGSRSNRRPRHGSIRPVCARALLCLTVSTGTAFGNDNNPFDTPESLYLGDIPVVLSGTRLAQPLTESPVAITVIDREMITASGAREIPDLFRLVPGMIVGSRTGHDRDVGYLGLLDAFSRRMQVLIDGRTAYDPLVGGVNWSTLPLDVEDIERIEVIRGPNAASFGSNSFLGTIIITTRQQFDMARTHAVVRTGSDGVFDVNAGFGDNGPTWDYHLTFGHRQDDGFANLHDGKRVNFLQGELGRRLDSETRLELKAAYSAGDLEIEDPIGQRTADTNEGFLLGRWQRDLGTDSGLTLTAYHQWTHWEESDRLADNLGPFFLTADIKRESDTERTDFELEHRFRLAQDWRGVWGGEARFDSVEDAFDLGTSASFDNDLYRLFGHFEWQVTEAAQASFGLMWEESDLIDAQLSPRVGLVVHPGAGHTLRLSASRATRSPVIFEAYADQSVVLDIVSPPPQAGCDALYGILLGPAAPSPAPCQVTTLLNWTRTPLDPEKITSYELGYRYGAGLGRLPGNLAIDLKLFRKELDDLVANDFTPAPVSSGGLANISGSAIDYHNGGQMTLDGIEGSVEWRLPRGTRLIGGFSLVNADATTDNDQAEALADSVPDHTWMAMLIHRFDSGVTASLVANHVDDMNFLGDGKRVDAYTRLDARIGYQVRVGDSRAEFAFTLQNLGESYSDFTTDNLFDTRVLLSLLLENP